MQLKGKITKEVSQDSACCPPTYVLYTRLGYLCRPAADSSMSKAGERPLCTLTGALGMSRACIVWRDNVPATNPHANPHSRPLSNLEHTHIHRGIYKHLPSSPLPTNKCTEIIAETHAPFHMHNV